jgi:hypothetical protein
MAVSSRGVASMASYACGGLGVSWRVRFGGVFLRFVGGIEGSPSCSKMGKNQLLLLFAIAARL